jgi:putative nucleotidyltransferase with HDIG domain
MTRAKKNRKAEGGFFPALAGLIKKNLPALRPGPAAATAAAFLVTVILAAGNLRESRESEPGEFEAGRVADRDVIAGRPVSYIDEEGTRRRLETQELLVPAVFRYSQSASGEMRRAYSRFREFAEGLFREETGEEPGKTAFVQTLEGEFPGLFHTAALEALYGNHERVRVLEYAASALETVMEEGIFALFPPELEPYNPDMAELIRQSASGAKSNLLLYAQIITRDKARELAGRYIIRGILEPESETLAGELLLPFITENVFFSPEDTRQRVAEIQARTDPVMKYIERGQLVIRKGFIITGENMEALEALNLSGPGEDLRNFFGVLILLILLYGLLLFLGGGPFIGRTLSNPEIYLVSILSALYLGGAAFTKNLSFNTELLPVSLLLPTALVVMLPSILIGARLAMVLALALPLGAFFAGSFDFSAFIFALFSGAVASYALQGAERRMDLIRAGLVIAGTNCAALIAVLLVQRAPPGAYPALIFWAAFNGVASGMLVLGLLPPLEHALNAATSFRLIELSDLNAPVLKRLFSAAPGTYSHSLMVANLAEAAAQEIGANPLLARVGAYYHDIGKMEQPDYFVENQTVYNQHDDLAPRLSATVIRSHVKIGVEKARALGLPQAVTDIVAEHHGNSLITWFYNEALNREGQVNMEDFSYPGNPPRSRESAVVMLADMTEAAVRTLQKPTPAKIDKFIQELIGAKVDHGQLARSELTFRDLETIKNAFVRVLAGHYHSRIEYPKLPGEKEGAE